jgi:FAD/FMN-containing dehydrogenase
LAVQKLATEFTGELLRPDDTGYDDARAVWNGMFSERRPALVARCRTTADVVAAVNFARTNDIEIAVRGGGHSIAGFSVCEGGLVIDLSPMKQIEVDADARVARAQPGVLLGELDAATQVHGLATTLGFVSITGIAGLTLNGGMGYLSRKHGHTCDNLTAAEVVLADGTVVHASDTENADLMWGLRGGGGNFGIVTRFEYSLHEVTELYGHMRFYDASALEDVLRAFVHETPKLPDDAVAFFATMTVPENPMMPPELHGKFAVMVLIGCIGNEEFGKPVVSRVELGRTPVFEMAMTMPYQMVQMIQDADVPAGRRNYWKAGNLTSVPDEAIEVFAQRAVTATSPFCSTSLILLGGAIARVGETDTAYSGRDALFNFSIDNAWEDPAQDAQQIAWSQSFYEAMTPHLSGGAYLNFVSEEPADKVRQAYGANYERLAALKDTYDPTNLFHMNQNIKPTRRP